MSDWLDDELADLRKCARYHGLRRAHKETADDQLKGTYAKLHDDVPKERTTVADRDAWVRQQAEYKNAIIRKENAWADWMETEIKMKITLAQLDKYRTDKSYAKSVDKMHT